MKKIILDTNFLLIPFTLKVDIFPEIKRIMDDIYKLYIVDKTLDELQNIIETQSGKSKKAAIFALELVNKKEIELIQTEINDNTVDKEIISLAKKEDYIIATQDKLLKAQLKPLNRKLIVLRQKSHLEIKG